MLVAAHKHAPMPVDAMYLPVQVGRVLAEADLGYQSDAEGQNISELNRAYCELTALYWAWKNLDADAVGLSHYRRYFSGTAAGPRGSRVMSSDEAADALKRADLVLAKPRNYVLETIESHYRHGHYGEDLDVLRETISRLSPRYSDAFEHVMKGRQLSLYNMFLTSRQNFEDIASWLFAVLEDASKSIDNESRSDYQQRTFGYLGERLLNVWARAHQDSLRIHYARVVNTEGEPKVQKAFSLLKRKVSGRAQ